MKQIKKKNLSHYILAKKKIINLLNKKYIISIYEYGNYNYPGLSDIDLMIVVNEKKVKNLNKDLIALYKDKELNYFINYSTIMIVNKKIMKNILYFDDMKLNKIYGEDLILNKIKEKNLLRIISVIDWLPERLLKLKMLKKQEVTYPKQELGFLNSFCLSLKNANFFLKKRYIKNYINKVENLRKLSLQTISIKRIKKIKSIGLEIGKTTLLDFSSFLLKKKLNFKINNSFGIKLYKNFRINFVFKSPKLTETKNELNIPIVYGVIFLHYFLKKDLSKFMQNNIYLNNKSPKLLLDNRILGILNLRSKLIIENIKLIKKLKIEKGLIKFGWFVKNKI